MPTETTVLKATPGPWEVAENGVGVVASALKGRVRWTDEQGVDHDAPLGLVALVYSCHAVGGYDGPGALESNIRLIAAAPELLSALKAIVADPYGCRFCDSGKLRTPNNPEKDHDATCGYVLARAATAKAEGQAQS